MTEFSLTAVETAVLLVYGLCLVALAGLMLDHCIRWMRDSKRRGHP